MVDLGGWHRGLPDRGDRPDQSRGIEQGLT
jgi:hypothetical protein